MFYVSKKIKINFSNALTLLFVNANFITFSIARFKFEAPDIYSVAEISERTFERHLCPRNENSNSGSWLYCINEALILKLNKFSINVNFL